MYPAVTTSKTGIHDFIVLLGFPESPKLIFCGVSPDVCLLYQSGITDNDGTGGLKVVPVSIPEEINLILLLEFWRIDFIK
jgi:hypothetical protein